MKRKIFALALAGLVAFSFTSCGDDDDNPAPVNPNNNNGGTTDNGGTNNNGGTNDNNGGNSGDNNGGQTGKNHYIVVECPEQSAQDWDSQFWIVLPEPVADGDDIKITMKVKADVATVDADGKEVNFGLQWHENPSDYMGNLAVGHTFTTEWKEIVLEDKVTLPEGKVFKSITYNLNAFDPENKYYWDDISVTVNGVEKVKNGNMEGTDFSSFAYKTQGKEADTEGADGKPEPGKGFTAVEE